MNIDAVILQLRTYAPIFGGRVAGAASYAMASDQVWMAQPAAYVIPLADEASPNQNQTGLYQEVTEKVGVIIDLANKEDRRGQDAAGQVVDEYRRAVLAALLRWRPDPTAQTMGFRYDGSGLLQVTRAWLRWQFDFAIETTITDSDGWQPPSDPLTEIRGTVTDQTTGAVSIDSRANPAQA
ncbi:phage tail terminator protein [Roseomonas elaeocarpi]|uniref:Phage tail protein n=1 Tax=Roseomonas elaeocarpi TaxID=907779 RepID=A0ABV6JRF3_9PROT